MAELNLNPTPVDVILILTQRDYIKLESSCTSSVLRMGIKILLCVLKIYALLRHTVAKKIGTILAPAKAL